jgi:PAS domain S-box-containing protein
MNSNTPKRGHADGLKDLSSTVADLQNEPKQRGAEVALAESERRFRDLVETSHDLIWAVDETGRITYLNQACRKIYGREPEEMIGHMFLEFVPPEQYEKDLAAFNEAIRTGKQTVDYTSRIYHADGSIVILTANAVIMRDNDGRVIGSTGIARDMTERLSAAGALRNREQEQRRLAQQLEKERLQLVAAQRVGKVGCWEMDLATMAVIWSEETYRIFETAPAGFQPTHDAFLQIVHPEDRKKVDAAFLESLAHSSPCSIEHRVLLPGGKIKFVEERWQAFADDSGKPDKAIGTCQDITERKLAEALLRRSETLLRIAGKAARLGGWAIELPEYKLTWSDETCVIHDLPPGYQPTFEEGVSLFPPESRAEVARCVESCARDGKSYDFEVPKITAKGRRIWVRSMGEAVRDADGRIIRLQGAFQDITERKHAELELSKSNRALRMLSACGGALTKMTEEKQLLNEICRLAVEIGGYRMAWVGYAQDDAARSIIPITHAGEELDYLSRIKPSWSADDLAGQGPAGQVIRSGKAVVLDDIGRQDAYFKWHEDAQARGYRGVICLPLRDEKRTFGLLGLYSGEINQPGADELGLLQELADDLAFGIGNLRARAEHRKAQQEIARQAALLDKATDAIVIRDLANRVIFWNSGAERVYGWKAGEAIGRTVSEFLYSDLFGFLPAMQAVLQKGEWVGELQKKTRTGQLVTMDCRWTLVRNEQQEPDSVLCIETDVTERKKLESNLLRAQRMESIGTLAGGIAHDLNNVLAPILMSVALLKTKITDADSERLLHTLQKSAQRGADLVRQVLSFARGVEGQRIEIDPAQLLCEIRSVVRETFPKSIIFELAAKKNRCSVMGDPTQLHQVFLNLCVNARDAMPNGGTLTIKLENVGLDESFATMNADAKPGAYVAVQVEDTGSGIPPEIRDRIFEPFFTTKAVGKGTGLGLSTTLAIVKSHGGFINVSSEVGKGTNFMVYLPANTPRAATDQVTVEPSRSPRGNGELIMVVDDEESIRQVARQILERFGYRVLLACQGEEAVALYVRRQEEIAVVLTDMAMPVMDGPALIIALKSLNPQVRIIGSSGHTSPGGMANLAGVGVAHFVPKPYPAELLLKTVHGALNATTTTNKHEYE